jgi:DegV family protein with EDD domain
MIKIVTDSTSNLPPQMLKELDIRQVPIAIQFGEESYDEGVNIDRPLFYRKIEELGIIPTTSQPSPAAFARHYQELSDQGHDILVITLTSHHSGTYQSAQMAQAMVPQARVVLFDSLNISLATGWMIIEAARAVADGKSMDEVLGRLAAIRDSIRLFLTPSTLKYLQMSGRVGRLQGALGSLLQLKPIISVDGGQLEAIENVRTRSRALSRMLEMLQATVGAQTPVNLAIIHANAPAEGQMLLAQAQQRFNIVESMTGELAASLAVHGGPGILGICAYPAQA